jgi:hypothetical protein
MEYAPIIEKAFNEKQINFLTLEYPKKTMNSWKHLQTKSNSITKLKNHENNVGVILGFNKDKNDCYLAGIDIDSFNPTDDQLKEMKGLNKSDKEIISNLTEDEQIQIRNKTRKDLYNLLKDLSDLWVDFTANHGYHLIYWTKKDFKNKYLENIHYPKDYSIEFLRDKPITFFTKHIEHFTHGKQFVVPFSEIEQKDGTVSHYEFISTPEELTDFFENPQPKENILNDIKELVQNSDSGFIYKEPESIETASNIKNIQKSSNDNSSINIGAGLVKSKIHNPEIRKPLLKNIVRAGYVQGNRNNFGYILVCNFRRHGLTKKEIYNIFKELKVPKHDLKEVKSWINNKFKVNLNSIENMKYTGFNALQKEIKALTNPYEADKLIKWFQDFFYDVISVFKKNPDSRKDIVKLAEFVENEYNIFKTLDKSKKPVYYYLNYDLSTFENINYHELGIKVFKDYGLRLPDLKFKTVLESCQKYKNIHTHFIEFENVYIHTKTFKIYIKERYSFLTNKKFIIELEDNEKHFLRYENDVKLFNTGNNETDIEKAIKEILIPKKDQTNYNIYIDWLQRLGACNSLNHKVISGYLGGGDNGKSVLNILSSEIFNNMYSGIIPKTFQKEHNKGAFEDKHIVAIDELDTTSFISIIPDVKRFRGGGVPVSDRAMYEQKFYTNKDYGMLWLYSNYVPSIPLNEIALFRSMDIITLPNIFVDEHELNNYPNGYLKEKQISERLKQDIKGLNWLLNISIKEYKKILEAGGNFELSQTSDETIAIITQNDYYLNFLALYVEIDEYNAITMKEINERFKEWVKDMNYNINLPNDLKIRQTLGRKLKELHPNYELKAKNPGGKKHYKLRVKTKTEVNKRPYEINENTLDNDPYILKNLDINEKRVYNAINKGLNTYSTLNNEFPDIKLIETLNNLMNIDLICQNSQTEIKSYG